MVTSQHGYVEIAKLLLGHSADVDAKEDNLWTALHLASTYGHLEIVNILLDAGADIHAQNINGHTLSGLASRNGERDIVRLLSGVKLKSPRVWTILSSLSLS